LCKQMLFIIFIIANNSGKSSFDNWNFSNLISEIDSV